MTLQTCSEINLIIYQNDRKIMNKVIIQKEDNGIMKNKQHETTANKSCYTNFIILPKLIR